MLKRSMPDPSRVPQTPASPQAGLRLGDVLTSIQAMLRRRLWLMTAITVALTVIALVLIAIITPKYDAVTRIRIDPSRNPMTQDQSQSMLNSEQIETEIGVMTSAELARNVVARLHLDRDPEFVVAADPEHPELSGDHLNRVARKVMRNVSVGRDKLSYIVALGFRSRDPEKAAQIANVFADAYLDLRVRTQVGTSSRQADFFKSRLAELAAAVNAADSKLAEYRAQAGISENSATGSVADQQIAPLSSQLATAEAEAAAARSNASVAQGQVARGGLDAVSEVRNSTVIGDLRRQRAEIVRNMGEVEARYGPRHPESVRVHDQLAAIDQQIRDEANRVVTSLQAQASAAQAQVSSLRGTMHGLQAERAQNTRASAQAERLERDAQSARASYDKMSQLSLESTQSARGSIAQAEIIDRARAPSAPTSPHKSMLAVLAFLVAVAIALAVAIVLELTQRGMRTTDEIEDRYGLPLLASLPQHGAKPRRFARRAAGSPADSIGAAGATVFSEAVRNLRTSLFRPGEANAAQVVAFTSALPGEGKTTTSLSLARMLAVNGTRTLLIDCDLRNSGLRALVGERTQPGLVDILSGKATLADAAFADTVDGLHLLTVSSTVFTSQDLFGDGRMGRLLETAKAEYGAIVLDLPPALGVADARTLAMLVDSVALVVRWGHTPPHAVDLAVSMLESDGVNLAGIVYAMVDPLAEAAGGVYYSRGYNKYYLAA